MSLLGTNVAQGVAATSHTAQQVARSRDRRDADRRRAIDRVQQAFDAHLRALEEADADQFLTRLRVDERPQRSPADDRLAAEGDRPEADARPAAADLVSQDAPASPPALYRHLDLTA